MPGNPASARDPGLVAAERAVQVYRLYVSSISPISSRAVVNARSFLNRVLPGAHSLEVLDIVEHVVRARSDQIIASPTLIRLSPLPVRRFIGDMSDVERLRTALGVTVSDA